MVNRYGDVLWEQFVRADTQRWQDFIQARIETDDNECWNFLGKSRIVCLYFDKRSTTVEAKKLSYVAFVDFAHGCSVRHDPLDPESQCTNPDHLRCGVTACFNLEMTPRLLAQILAMRNMAPKTIAQRLNLSHRVVSRVLQGRHTLQTSQTRIDYRDDPPLTPGAKLVPWFDVVAQKRMKK